MRTAGRSLPKSCSLPSAKNRGRQILWAQSFRAHRLDQGRRSLRGEYRPVDRSRWDRVSHPETVEPQRVICPLQSAAPREFAGKASPNPRQNDREKDLERNRPPVDRQRAAPPLVEFLFVVVLQSQSLGNVNPPEWAAHEL